LRNFADAFELYVETEPIAERRREARLVADVETLLTVDVGLSDRYRALLRDCRNTRRERKILRAELRSVEVEDLSVWLDRIALRFPGCQSTFEELDPGKMHGQSSIQYCSAGFLTRTGAVNDRFFFCGD